GIATIKHPKTVPHGSPAPAAGTVSFAAVPGSAIPRFSAQPLAMGTSPTSGSTTSASGSGGRLPLESLVLYLFGSRRSPGRFFFEGSAADISRRTGTAIEAYDRFVMRLVQTVALNRLTPR